MPLKQQKSLCVTPWFANSVQSGAMGMTSTFRSQVICVNLELVFPSRQVLMVDWLSVGWLMLLVSYSHQLSAYTINVQYSSSSCKGASGVLQITGSHTAIFPCVNWTFLLGVTVEALRAKIDWKSVVSKRVAQYAPNFHAEGNVPHQSFLHGEWHFSHKESL